MPKGARSADKRGLSCTCPVGPPAPNWCLWVLVTGGCRAAIAPVAVRRAVVGAQFAVLGAAEALDGFCPRPPRAGERCAGAKERAAATASSMGALALNQCTRASMPVPAWPAWTRLAIILKATAVQEGGRRLGVVGRHLVGGRVAADEPLEPGQGADSRSGWGLTAGARDQWPVWARPCGTACSSYRIRRLGLWLINGLASRVPCPHSARCGGPRAAPTQRGGAGPPPGRDRRFR
jgi:hypothetical protein